MNEMQQTRVFPPEVFARLAPDIYFQRHLAHNLRPTGRGLLEKRPLDVRPGTPQTLSGSLGSAVVRAGSATVVCGINGGLTRFKTESGIYANVEIHRGGMAGMPTGEEQVLTTRVHRLLGAAGISSKNFVINSEMSLCLTAQIIVLSRTGPMLDLVWECLVSALKSAKIPTFAEDERTGELTPTTQFYSLDLPDSITSSHNSYGVVGDFILADIDGAVEEECVQTRVSVAKSSSQNLTAFTITAPEGLTRKKIAEVLSKDIY